MESLKEKFVEEALEYLDQLEVALLKLESTPEDQDLIEQIFRIMHTLKGNSAMFGFNLIDQFTHQLETIYDLIRSGEMKVSRELIDLTLSSVDHIGNLLDEDNSSEKDVQNTHQKLLHAINQIIEKSNVEEEPSQGDIPVEISIYEKEKGFRTYYIHFEPDPDILSNGSNPLYLIDDFSTVPNATSSGIVDLMGSIITGEIEANDSGTGPAIRAQWKFEMATQFPITKAIIIYSCDDRSLIDSVCQVDIEDGTTPLQIIDVDIPATGVSVDITGEDNGTGKTVRLYFNTGLSVPEGGQVTIESLELFGSGVNPFV